MDHREIDQDAVAERYLRHALTPEDRDAFEEHLVDCTECIDRLLLAEMFHVRNGDAPAPSVPQAVPQPAPHSVTQDAPLPRRVRFVASLRPWQLLVILTLAAMILVVLPAILFRWVSRP